MAEERKGRGHLLLLLFNKIKDLLIFQKSKEKSFANKSN